MATVELQPVRPVNVLAGGIVSTRVGASLSCLGAQVNVSVLAPAPMGPSWTIFAPRTSSSPRLDVCNALARRSRSLTSTCRAAAGARGGGAGARPAARARMARRGTPSCDDEWEWSRRGSNP